MATNNLAGVYNGGAVQLNSQPYVNAYQQTVLRKQAQDDALFKYFGDFGKNLTPAGMHSNDVDALMQKKNQWQQFVMQNKDAYLHPSKDNGKAYTHAMALYNDALSTTQLSKDKVKSLASVGSIYKDPNKRGLLTDQTMHDIEAGELPVTDPNYRPIDLTHINYNPKPWDIKDQTALLGQVSRFKGTEGQPLITRDRANNQQIIHYPNEFGKNELLGMHNMGASLYGSTPGFKNIVDNLAKAGADPTDPNHSQFVQLNDLYKQHYGQDIQTPEDVAGAYVLSLNPTKSGRTVVKNDQAALNVQKSQLIEGRSNRKAAQTGGTWVDDAAAAVGSKNPDEMKKVFGHLFAGNGTAKHQDVNLNPDGTALQIHYTTKGKDKYGAFDEKHTVDLPLNDPNFKDKLAGYYQLTTGADKKTENKPYYKEPTVKSEHANLSADPKDWKKVGNNYQYKDGSLYDAEGKKIK